MKKIALLLLLINFICCSLFAQLKENNYLLLSKDKNVKLIFKDSIGFRAYKIANTNFKYSKDLFFYYTPTYHNNSCCSYQQSKEIPETWNIVTVADIVQHLEEKRTIKTSLNKLFMVERDSCKHLYKAYQVYIQDGKWMTD